MKEPKKIFESGRLEIDQYWTKEEEDKYRVPHLIFLIDGIGVCISGDEVWRLADVLDQYGIHP